MSKKKNSYTDIQIVKYLEEKKKFSFCKASNLSLKCTGSLHQE